jgi:hypothetical protein
MYKEFCIDENSECEFSTFRRSIIRNSCGKCDHRSLARIGPAIPVQRSNQLSYRVQLSSSNHKFMFIEGPEGGVPIPFPT